MKLINSIKKSWQVYIFILFSILSPIISFAQQDSGSGCDEAKEICNPLRATSTLPELIHKVLEGALRIGIPLIALAVIYCGFLFVKAQGNPEEITKAKDALLYTLIGSGILLGAWAISQMILATVKGLAS